MEQFFVLLVVAVFAWLNWLVKQSASKRPPAGGTRRPPPRPTGPPREEADDSVRELLEALGVPKTSIPSPSRGVPPVFRPRQAPVGPVVLPAPVAPRPIPRSVPPPPSIPVVQAPASEVEAAAAPAPVVPEQAPVAPLLVPDAYGQTVAPVAASVRILLKTPGSIRTAIILREVLGPPLSLQV